MDQQQREHIHDDLKRLLKGELLFDELSRGLYSTDASIFQIEPLGVAAPRDEEDVQSLVRYAAEHRIPLIPRGAGSGVAGESLGSGIILDMSRHFRSILEVGADSVRVQPGVVLRDLNVRLAREGRRFAPDPSSGAQCTLGGMLATNASGARALRHGYTRDHVEKVRVVLDNGESAEAARLPRHAAQASPGRLHDIARSVEALLEHNQAILTPGTVRTRFNRCGYLVHDVLTPDHLDLARLLVGSEGTLAVFTEATLSTEPLPAGRSLVLLGFTGLEVALRAAQRIMGSRPSACELIEHRLLTLAREADPAIATLVPAGAEVVLLVEYESASVGGAAESAAELTDRLLRTERLAVHAVTASGAEEIERLWNLREAALPSLYGMRGRASPLPFIEDVGVPVEELPVYLRRVQDVLQKHETTASFLVHACTGQVHTRPFLDPRKPEDIAKLWAIADEVHSLALDLHGTVSTQHGTGLARTPWVARQYGKLYHVMRSLKAIFDPRHLFNPGKIVGLDLGKPAWPLRRAPREEELLAAPADEGTEGEGVARAKGSPARPAASLRWQPGELLAEVMSCNGCGQCRTEAPGQRMCPIFRATHAESASPRAKANLLLHLLQQEEGGPSLSSDAVREVADLCVNCKMCAHECPAHVNIPKMMLEAKAANVAEHGLTRADWALARVESFAAFGSAFALAVNLLLGSPAVRWVLEKLLGISRRRRLPTFAARSFLQRAARRGWTRLPPPTSRPRVVYFVDVFANYNDPQIAEAAVAVLRHNGFDVFVPPGQVGSGLAALSQGDVDTARESALINLRVLADLAREGYPLICSEPAAALMLRHDYRDLFDNPDSRLVAERAVELTTFLWGLHREGKLRTDFKPLELALGHHVPCHVKALGPARGPALLGLIPRLRVHTIDVSCSGMAGTFGLKAENYAVSREAGRPMLEELARPNILFGSTECSTCRLQMEDGARKRTLHPVQYLALAYGLMPELAQRLQQPIPARVLQ